MPTPLGRPRAATRIGALALALACLSVVLLPAVGADHAYSHRYLVYGRVIDSEGNPVSGVTVRGGLDNEVTVEGPCGNQPNTETDAWGPTTTRPTTNEAGEFFFCFHMHQISRGTNAEAHAEADGVEARGTMDPQFRKSFLVVKVPGGNGTSSPLFNQYVVSGRLWFSEPEKRVDGITVMGDTVHEQTVKVTFRTTDGREVVKESKSNHYGDFGVRMNVSREEAAGGKITVETDGNSQQFDADPEAMWTDVNFRTDVSSGSNTALLVAGVVVVGAAVVGGGWFAWKKVAEGRADAAARERSTRKRAMK